MKLIKGTVIRKVTRSIAKMNTFEMDRHETLSELSGYNSEDGSFGIVKTGKHGYEIIHNDSRLKLPGFHHSLKEARKLVFELIASGFNWQKTLGYNDLIKAKEIYMACIEKLAAKEIKP